MMLESLAYFAVGYVVGRYVVAPLLVWLLRGTDGRA